MFKKKEALKTPEIQARFVKKDGIETGPSTSTFDRNHNSQQQKLHKFHQVNSSRPLLRYPKDNKIPTHEITDSYITHNVYAQQEKNRRRFSPSNLLFRKKKIPTSASSPNGFLGARIEEEDMTEIAYYDDLLAEQQSISQHDDPQLNAMDLEAMEREYKQRMQYIMNNYRHPPPYPGNKRSAKEKPHIENNKQPGDTPLIAQLLKDKNLKDNTSMNNLYTKVGDVKKKTSVSDKLVKRTKEIIVRSDAKNADILNPGELYEKRRQYYLDMHQKSLNNRDTVSEIYPLRDYERENAGQSMSVSTPDLTALKDHPVRRNNPRKRSPRSQLEPGELEAIIAHYRKNSLDSFAPYGGGDSISIYSNSSPSYVPPSPYLNAEIPEWLRVYSKASPDLDRYLKWEMFRYPELDCWQTMIKRLYKAEVEKVVLWFEEYRCALQNEMEDRRSITTLCRKTDV